MNKSLSYFATTFFIILAFLHSPTNAWAAPHSADKKGDYPFPLPPGTVTLNRALQSGHDGHDFHLYHGHKNEETKADPNASSITGSCLEYGIPILAVEPGIVVVANQTGYNGGMGTSVIIDAENGNRTMYMHMVENGLLVAKDEKVERGQIIGLMGSTGASMGNTCTINKENPITGEKEKVKVSGVHLHFEIRSNLKNVWYAHPVNSFIGKEVYTKMVGGGTYGSTTKMYDPKGFWNQFGYRYDFVMPEGAIDYSGTWSPENMPTLASATKEAPTPTSSTLPKLISVSPNQVREDEKITFTINGENLPKNLELDYPPCKDTVEWIERGSSQQKFTCTIDLPGVTMGFLKVPGVKTADNENLQMSFDVKIIGKNEGIPKTSYDGFPKVPPSAQPGDKINLKVTGQNLPPDLTFDLPFCSELRFLKRGLQMQTMECVIASNSYNKSGKIKNEIIAYDIQVKDANGNLVTSGNLVLDHRLQIESITPPIAYFGQKVSFTIRGKNVHKLTTFHLDYCQNLVVLSQSSLKDQVVIQCTLPVPEAFFSPLMPDGLKRKTLNLHIKDKPGGQMILAGKIEAMAFSQSGVREVGPVYSTLNENEVFSVVGDHLPDRLLYWVAHCGQGEIQVIDEDRATFACKPEPIGKDALKKIELAALTVKDEPSKFMKEIEKQRRLVEIKYPREYSEDGKTATVLYRGFVLPLPEKYADLYFDTLKNLKEDSPSALFLDAANQEDIIAYILSHPGDYSNTFLKKMGWKNVGSGGKPFYELVTCSSKLQKSTQTHVAKMLPPSKLNTTGACAKGLDLILIQQELGKMYPEKAMK